MRHALVAESSKAEIRTDIELLQKECLELDDMLSDLENETKEIMKQDEEDRTILAEDHAKFRKEQALVVFNIKDEIDTALQNPNILNNT